MPADPVLLSLFGHRFQGIAETAGLTLQKTAISANIKERLDYSVAIFDAAGALVANAPHLPVHLGSMSFAVRYQIEYLRGDIQPGDVILANHPAAGGSHLPDMTVISPVFDGEEIIFYTASRGHHVDIGGILPGSMPPTSTALWQEGAQIKSFKLVRRGVYDHEGLYDYLVTQPAKFQGCSGSRAFRDVESDLQAQIAANNKGIKLLEALVKEWSLETVQEYMVHIRDNAELSVRNLLRDVAKTHGTQLSAIDWMDDGSPIQLAITLDPKAGSATFDFTGTGPQVIANFNCPRSVVYSAIIYCLRAMVRVDIPLNQGCLVPVSVVIPPGSLLDPSDTAAVVGGNVMTSQRITDVVLHAFRACAASQGCCNNLTWGTPVDANGQGVSNYETIAGGSGAGPGWHGTSGVQVHMTNTRITDAEIMERRFPVIVRQFAIRADSGGAGEFRGGDGAVRDIEFLTPGMQVSILSERRVHQPYGMLGGEPGQTGLNLWVKQRRAEDGDLLTPEQVAAQPALVRDTHVGGQGARVINMGPKATATMGRGDRIVVHTPGGGGWGDPARSGREKHTVAYSTRKGSVADWQALQLGA